MLIGDLWTWTIDDEGVLQLKDIRHQGINVDNWDVHPTKLEALKALLKPRQKTVLEAEIELERIIELICAEERANESSK